MKPTVKFDTRKTVQYWLEGADYDLSVAEAMFEKRKYPYALFMGHLALEKLLKALVVKATDDHAPYTHSLSLLATKSGVKVPQKTTRALARFMEFHFEARYPSDQKKFYRKCTKEFRTKKAEKNERGFSVVEKTIRQIINAFIKELRKNKINVAKVILYGSRAAGRAHEYSDIDVAIVSPDFGKDRYREGAKLFEIACTIDPRIEPIPISVSSYNNDTWIPIIYEIRKNGIELKTV